MKRIRHRLPLHQQLVQLALVVVLDRARAFEALLARLNILRRLGVELGCSAFKLKLGLNSSRMGALLSYCLAFALVLIKVSVLGVLHCFGCYGLVETLVHKDSCIAVCQIHRFSNFYRADAGAGLLLVTAGLVLSKELVALGCYAELVASPIRIVNKLLELEHVRLHWVVGRRVDVQIELAAGVEEVSVDQETFLVERCD